jgi:hypothetical protein
MLACGWSNRRIADTCFLSLNTVRTHVQNVLVKLGVHSKLEAAALAVRPGAGQHRGPPGLGAPRPGAVSLEAVAAHLRALASSITLAARWEGSSS